MLIDSIIVFVTQLIFIGTRTWNIRSVAAGNIPMAVLSGLVVGSSWLYSLHLGTNSMGELTKNSDLSHIPVILSFLAGGAVGTYISMIKKKRNGKI